MAQLSSIAFSRSVPAALVQRARIVLACAAGESNSAVARRFELTNATVDKLRRRFVRRRISGLSPERLHFLSQLSPDFEVDLDLYYSHFAISPASGTGWPSEKGTMKRSGSSDERIAYALRQAEGGTRRRGQV
jgi:hypothetical protein